MNHLGLVCITFSEEVRYRALTRTRLLAMDPAAQNAALRQLYSDNLDRFGKAIAFCAGLEIMLYRLPSTFLPFADTEQGREIMLEAAPRLRILGQQIRASGLRVVIHPDQWVVLNSDEPRVIANAVNNLRYQGELLDLLEQPRSAWAAVNVHGGKGGRGERLVETLLALPEAVRSRLTLENDERCYGAREIHDLCQRGGVPMVFDAHHHVIREGLDSYDDPDVADCLKLASQTWSPPEWQLVHISNGSTKFNDSRHSDLIAAMPECYRCAPWIEVEAKHKELALGALRQQGWETN